MDDEIQCLTQQLNALKTSLSTQSESFHVGSGPPQYAQIGIFTGTGQGEQIYDFLDRFDLHCAARDFDEAKKLKFLPLHLAEVAFDVYRSLDANERSTYKNLTDALHASFATAEDAKLYTSALHQFYQQSLSVAEYAAQLRRLARLSAYRSLDAASLDIILLHLFVDHLRPELKILMNMSAVAPASFKDAIALARQEEG